MSTTYNLTTASFVAAVTVPQDGVDNPTVASILAAVEAIGNNTGYLEDKAFYGVEGYIHVPLGEPMYNAGAPVRWSFDRTLMAWVQTDITDAGEIMWPVKIGIKGRITKVLAEIDGDAGPGAANHTAAGLPVTMPIITLYRIEYSATGSEVTTIGATQDPAAGPAAYDSPHTFGSSIAEDIAEDRSYYVGFTGEAGAGALVDELLLADIRIKIEAVP